MSARTQHTSTAKATPIARTARPVVKGLFHNVAFWQGATFVMLVCVIWINEVLDLPRLFFGRYPAPADWFGACILTAGVLLVGIITVGHTYVQQQQILKGIIIVCSYCERVKIAETSWERIEEYLAAKTLARFSHGVCPECFGKNHGVNETCRPSPAPKQTENVPPRTVVESARRTVAARKTPSAPAPVHASTGVAS